jgi:hypothetical protein
MLRKDIMFSWVLRITKHYAEEYSP